MPKEVTHILFAEKLSHSWKDLKDPQLALLLQKYPQIFHLGAISHDIFFYDIQLPWEKKAKIWGQSWGNAIHGSEGEHTMAHIYAMADILRQEELQKPLGKRISLQEKEKLAVFAMGYLTHVALDATLHPMVYYFSGNYYAPEKEAKRLSETRHRVFESLLDLWLLEKNGKDLKDYSLKAKASPDKKDKVLIAKFYALALRMAFGLEKKPQNLKKPVYYKALIEEDPLYHTVCRSFKKQYFFNQCFHNPYLAKMVFFINKWKKDSLSEFSALYYPKKKYSDYQKKWHNPLNLDELKSFCDPLTNRKKTIDYAKIQKELFLKAKGYILAFYELWQKGISPKVKNILNGPSLNNGRPGIPTAQMQYFSPLPVNGNFELMV